RPGGALHLALVLAAALVGRRDTRAVRPLAVPRAAPAGRGAAAVRALSRDARPDLPLPPRGDGRVPARGADPPVTRARWTSAGLLAALAALAGWMRLHGRHEGLLYPDGYQ